MSISIQWFSSVWTVETHIQAIFAGLREDAFGWDWNLTSFEFFLGDNSVGQSPASEARVQRRVHEGGSFLPFVNLSGLLPSATFKGPKAFPVNKQPDTAAAGRCGMCVCKGRPNYHTTIVNRSCVKAQQALRMQTHTHTRPRLACVKQEDDEALLPLMSVR